MKIDLSKAVRGDEFELRGGNVAIFQDSNGLGEFPYICIIDEQLCSFKQDGSYISATEHSLDIVKALTIPEQEVDPVQEVLDMIITTIEESSKSSKVLFDLVKFNTSRIDSLENKIDILMSERNTPEVSEGIDLSKAVKDDKFLTRGGEIAVFDCGSVVDNYPYMCTIGVVGVSYKKDGSFMLGQTDRLDIVKKSTKESIEDNVCSKIQERKALGLEKYGTTMERTDLSIDEWLTHAQEEAMDFSIYLEKIIAIRKDGNK